MPVSAPSPLFNHLRRWLPRVVGVALSVIAIAVVGPRNVVNGLRAANPWLVAIAAAPVCLSRAAPPPALDRDAAGRASLRSQYFPGARLVGRLVRRDACPDLSLLPRARYPARTPDVYRCRRALVARGAAFRERHR